MQIKDHAGKQHEADTLDQVDRLLNGVRILRAKLLAYGGNNNYALNGIRDYQDRLLERRLTITRILNKDLDALFANGPRE